MKTSKVKKLGKSEPAPLKKKKKLKKEVEALPAKKAKKVKAKKPPLKQKIGQESIIIRERVYIPIHMVNTNDVKDAYTTKRYDKNACRKCENLPDRHSYLCDSCPAYLGEVRLFAKKTIKGRSYIGIPVGDKKHFERKTGLLFDECEFVDRRVYAPFHYKIKFLAELRDYQDSVITDFLKKKYGLLKAPPRTGKTLMSLYIGLQLGQRMLFLANQHEFVEQFIDHIHGNEAEGIPKCTNLPELEEKYGKKLYGTPKTDEDFENFQFFAMTYQAFISEKNGKNRFKKLTPHIGTVGVDEVDKSAAKEFSKVIGKFRTRYRFGVSGTIVRKDGMDFVTRALIGPVVAESKRESLTPTVILHDTGIKCNKSFQGKPGWVKAMQFLAKEKARNKLIVEWVIKDLAKGHNIVIPTYFKGHVDALMNAINDAYGKDICGKFVGGAGKKNKAERKAILSAAKAGKIRCIVGIRSLLQRGLNVPQWSAIYLQAPISNEPNLMQETSRVRTPLEEKRSPIIRLFFDQEVGQSVGCARNTIKHMKGFKYEFMKNEKQAGLLYTVLGSSRESDPYKNSDDDNFVARKSMFEGRAATRIPVKRL